MKKRLIFLFYIIASIFLIVMSTGSSALNTEAIDNSNEYVISSYNISIEVGENNIYDITETLTTNYKIDKHGIIRNIPTHFTIKRADGTSAETRAIISDLSVKRDTEIEEYSTSTARANKTDYFNIKIGSADEVLNGTHAYEISYKYNLGQDSLVGADEFYFNLIGLQWDTTIENVTFSITMPKDFEYDSDTLGFTWGYASQNFTSDVTYSVINRTITGALSKKLGPGQGLTIRLVLPENYFVGASDNLYNPFFTASIIMAIAFVVIAFAIFLIHKSRHLIVTPVSFYPPEKLTILDVAMGYKTYVEPKDVTALLISLANKGYIKILDTSKKRSFGLFSKEIKLGSNNFKFVEVKKYNGTDSDEKALMKGLFVSATVSETIFLKETVKELCQDEENRKMVEKLIKCKKLVENKFGYYDIDRRVEIDEKSQKFLSSNCPLEITSEELKELDFYETPQKILNKNNKISKRKKYLSSANIILHTFSIVLIVICSLMILLNAYDESVAVFLGIWLFTSIGLYAAKNRGMLYENSIVFVASQSITLAITSAIKTEGMSFILLCIILGITMFVILALFHRITLRTSYGYEIYGKILGFKNYLLSVEKPVLEKFVHENPTYFFDILPYTYVLGISDKWIKRLEEINIDFAKIRVYSSFSYINSFDQLNSFTNSLANITSIISGTPNMSSGSSSGGSSGGGMSGGGSGGGGGSSW